MTMSRRTFLKQAGFAGCAALAAASLPSWAHAATPMAGTLFGIGWRGNKYLGTDQNGANNMGTSLLTGIDMASGKTKQTIINVDNGHSVMPMNDGNLLCLPQMRAGGLFVDHDHTPLAPFTAPEGFVYGGHGLVMKDRNIAVVLMRRKEVAGLNDTSAVEVYDTKTFKKLDQIDTGGLQPHDMCLIPNNPGEIAVSHYGDLTGKFDPITQKIVDSKLTILDSATLKPKRHYQHNEFNAQFGHVRVDQNGWACIALNQYIRLPNVPGRIDHGGDVGEEIRQLAATEVKRLFNQKWDFPVSNDYFEFGLFDMALPILRINTQTGKMEIVNAGFRHQLRSQSVGYNPITGNTITVFRHSKNLVIHKIGAAPQVVEARDLGLDGLSGIDNIEGTSCIAVNAPMNGIAIYDIAAKRVVGKYDAKLYDSTHLFYAATA